MNMHMDKKIVASAAIAAATLGALAYVWKYKKGSIERLWASHCAHKDASDDIGPGEINPYADTPTDPANQN